MQKFLLSLIAVFLISTPLKALNLEDFLAVQGLGENVANWAPSPLVPDELVGRTFTIPSEGNKIYQLRFVTFEDRSGNLKNTSQFMEFVKAYGLEKLESKKDNAPYMDDTLYSFTFKNANEYLQSQGKPPLPDGVFFVISFRDVTDVLK